MADDPHKRYQDGWTVSFFQQYEYDYFREQIGKEFTHKTAQQIHDAIMNCRTSLQPSEGREKLKACVRLRLRS